MARACSAANVFLHANDRFDLVCECGWQGRAWKDSESAVSEWHDHCRAVRGTDD
jgi:hypothetical protein